MRTRRKRTVGLALLSGALAMVHAGPTVAGDIDARSCGAWHGLLRSHEAVASLSAQAPAAQWTERATAWRAQAVEFGKMTRDPGLRSVADNAQAAADAVRTLAAKGAIARTQRDELRTRGRSVLEAALSGATPVNPTWKASVRRVERVCGDLRSTPKADPADLFARYSVLALSQETGRIERVQSVTSAVATQLVDTADSMTAVGPGQLATFGAAGVELIDSRTLRRVRRWPLRTKSPSCISAIGSRVNITLAVGGVPVQRFADSPRLLVWPGLINGSQSCAVGTAKDVLVSAFGPNDMDLAVWAAAGVGARTTLVYRHPGCAAVASAPRAGANAEAIVHLNCLSEAESGIYSVDAIGIETQLFHGRVATPTPTPDGRWIVFVQNGDTEGVLNLWALDRDRSNAVVQIAANHSSPVLVTR